MVKTSSSAVQTQSDLDDTMNSVALNVAGEDHNVHTSMIVPVWVSAKQNPNHERLVYALLDSQSDTTFIEKGVSDALQATMFPVRLKLTTMLGKSTILQSERVFRTSVNRLCHRTAVKEFPPITPANVLQVLESDFKDMEEETTKREDAEEVYDDGKEGETWYLPHHGVFHPKKADKLRVVFDCSARYQGYSLNDHLLQGPDLINSLHGILIRFHQHPIALMCDIEKMYH
ncbi:Translation initiation factor IF-2 [Labeo rohita]|uniref:Translation initiation factor IF-2 n=1 Tax=Labeo rohita TaxID=84645 RepID=A0ABQ8KZ79_LABRO|nr:Translation initiation factor IF-2 [Labeo rohita]